MKRQPATPENSIPETKRPWILTVLSLVFFLVGFYNIFKFVQVLLNLPLLLSLPITVSPLYLAADGLLWGISGLILFWGLWMGRTWSRKASLALTLLFTIVFWVDLIWISEPELLVTRWLISLILTALGVFAVFLILNLNSSRDFFKGNPAKIN
ncbi:MAG: hypothetical protein MUO54_11415 [Anaerolineales bacterium]|nr:hypothetical protein [Anaerolineales bacterium]